MNLPDFLVQDKYGYVHIRGHRIGLQDLVYFYNQGDSVEMIFCRFPTLSLAILHKVIAFYLENQIEVDAYVAKSQAAIDQARSTAAPGPSLAELRRRLDALQQARGA